MCGIAGYTTLPSGFKSCPDKINQMLDSISHRGPDATGKGVYDRVVFGNTRLSIIDVEGGDQPISNEDGNIVVVYNGEIYNSPELRADLIKKGHIFKTKSDTEVLVHLYEEQGEQFISSLNGMFAFALYDKRNEILLIARDRFGVKPLFYSIVNDEIRFASEIKALSCLSDFDKSLSPEGLSVALGLMFICEPWTAYKNVRRLRQGSYLRVDRTGYKEICYHDINLHNKIQIDKHSAAEETSRLLRQSVERQMLSDVPVSVLLSGGLDSRSVSYLASKLRSDVSAFTISFDESNFDESPEASRWADTIGVSHNRMVFDQDEFISTYLDRQKNLDEPYSLWCNTAQASMAKYINKEGYKVVLGGDGGDELFLGYPTIKAALLSRWYRRIPNCIRKSIITPLVSNLPTGDAKLPLTFMAKSFVDADDPNIYRAFFGFKEVIRYKHWEGLLTKEAMDFLGHIDPFIAHSQYLDKVKDMHLVDALSYMDYKVFLSGASLNGADNAYMSKSVELRVPFLDNDIAEFAASLPVNVRFSLFNEKPVLKEALRNRVIPNSEARTKKTLKGYRKSGFDVPGSAWLKDATFRKFVNEILSKRRIDRTGFFKFDSVKKILEDQFNGKQNNERIIQILCGITLFLDD